MGSRFIVGGGGFGSALGASSASVALALRSALAPGGASAVDRAAEVAESLASLGTAPELHGAGHVDRAGELRPT